MAKSRRAGTAMFLLRFHGGANFVGLRHATQARPNPFIILDTASPTKLQFCASSSGFSVSLGGVAPSKLQPGNVDGITFAIRAGVESRLRPAGAIPTTLLRPLKSLRRAVSLALSPRARGLLSAPRARVSSQLQRTPHAGLHVHVDPFLRHPAEHA